MAQQTAVDWFSEKVFDLFNEFQRGHISIVDFRLKMITIEEQAKTIEKEQIINADLHGSKRTIAGFDLTLSERRVKELAEQYYNQTFNQNK